MDLKKAIDKDSFFCRFSIDKRSDEFTFAKFKKRQA
jgi:hypothetical protein